MRVRAHEHQIAGLERVHQLIGTIPPAMAFSAARSRSRRRSGTLGPGSYASEVSSGPGEAPVAAAPAVATTVLARPSNSA